MPADAAVELLLPLATWGGRQVWPTADRDGDGREDLLVVAGADVYWPTGPIVDDVLGAPLFVEPIDGVWPGGDVTGDGLADLWSWSFYIWHVDLHAGPVPDPTVLSLGGYFGRVETADPDGDGLVDLVVRRDDGVGVCAVPAPGTISSGEDCTFVHGTSDAEFGIDFTTGDVTGDGVDDVLIGSRASSGTEYSYTPGVYLVPGPWPGEVSQYALAPALWVAPFGGTADPHPALAPVADLDGDGRPEVIVSVGTTTFVLTEENGALVEVARVEGAVTAETADLDGDGALELLVGGIDEASALVGPFAGTVDPGQALVHVTGPPHGAIWRLSAMDRNADGVRDLVVAEEQADGYVDGRSVWLIDGPFVP